MQIVVIQTAFLGDLFLCIPLLKNIKAYFPNSQLTLVCRQGFGSPLQEMGLIDRAFEIIKGDPASYKNVIQNLKNESVDYIFCPHQSYRSALMVAQLRAKRAKIGFRWWGSGLVFDSTVSYDKRWPDALRQLSLLQAVVPDFKEQWSKLEQSAELQSSDNVSDWVDFRSAVIPPWADMKWSHETRQAKKKQVILVPGSVWATKQWTQQGFSEVARYYQQQGFSVLLLGSQGERELCESIRSEVPQARNLAGQLQILDSIKLMEESGLVISNDSGAMHLASVAGTPTIAIFGPTTLALGYRPWNNNAIVVQKALSCRPCGKHGHQKCPIGTHECMRAIRPQDVIEAANRLAFV